MLAFIIRRLGQAVLVLLTVSLIAFALFRFVEFAKVSRKGCLPVRFMFMADQRVCDAG